MDDAQTIPPPQMHEIFSSIKQNVININIKWYDYDYNDVCLIQSEHI